MEHHDSVPPGPDPRAAKTALGISISLCIVSMGAVSASAQLCTVPGTHPTIQAALDEPLCAEIQLSPQAYEEPLQVSRSIELVGPPEAGAQVAGPILVAGNATRVRLERLEVATSCGPALLTQDGAQVDAFDVDFTIDGEEPCLDGPLFRDGFETGDTNAWSGAAPRRSGLLVQLPLEPTGRTRR